VGANPTATSVLKAMVMKFNEVAAATNLVSRAAQSGRTPYEIVTIASIAEKEGFESYFPQVARVIYNRLAAKKALELDSTQNYGLGISQEDLTLAQIKADTPYNTHLHAGLPPTPISNPGRAALEAALAPADGNWIYFLSIPGTKEMRFTDSWDQFLKDQQDMRAAQQRQSSGQ